ncbi:hypothetical protein NSS98_25380 [Paenibacillus sp. FSL E2-0274]|nr:hypothetical protein BSK63_28270 [Paenibacillus odorifer]
MANKTFQVIANFMDIETGEEVQIGSLIEADEDREAALRTAKVIGKEATKAQIDAAKKARDADAKADNGADGGTGDAGGDKEASKA